jgi:drug/metabolite transporter (DMT)-like permease
MMDTTLPTVVAAVLTFVSPLLTALFTHVQMDSTAKKNVAFGVSLVIAAVYVVMSGGVKDLSNLAEIAGAAMPVFTLQQLIFGNLLRGISDKIEAKAGVTRPAVAPAVAPQPNVNVYVSGAVGGDPEAVARNVANQIIGQG